MSETFTIVHGAELPDAARAKTPLSYCCECGTYDAHTTTCTCCGFDFRSDASDDVAEK